MKAKLCPECGSFAKKIEDWASFGYFVTDYVCVSCGKMFDKKEKMTTKEMLEHSDLHGHSDDP